MAVVEVERRGNVLVVTLNRPERRNALDREMIGLLGRAFADAEQDGSVAAVVLTGRGEKAFCAGMDLKAFAESGAPTPADGPGLEVFTGRIYPKPIIAAVNGPAVAGGFELVLACDLVVSADHATFGIPEVKRGLVAAGGGLLRLPRRLPLALALEMGLTGDPVPAQRAYELGLVNRVVPAAQVEEVALSLAGTVAANAPLALQVTKEVMLEVAAGDEADLREHLGKRMMSVFSSEDAREGALAFAEKRAPQWKGR